MSGGGGLFTARLLDQEPSVGEGGGGYLPHDQEPKV